MASKSKHHHFLPQFLLRGFAHSDTGRTPQTYLFRRGLEQGKLTSVRNIGGERYFHGNPAKSDLEARTADADGRYSALVTRLRIYDIAAGDLQLASEFMASQIVRTKSLRDSFAEGTANLTSAIARAFADPRNEASVREFVKQAFPTALTQPDLLKALGAIPEPLRSRCKAALPDLIEQALATPDLMKEISETIDAALKAADTMQIAARAQQESLSKHFAPPIRVATLKQFHWKVLRFERGTLILGDVGVLGLSNEGDIIHPVTMLADQPLAFLLPIGDASLLLAMRFLDLRQIDPEVLNVRSAELSRDFFVTSRCTVREQAYAQHLGAQASLISHTEIESVVRKLFREHKIS